MILNLLLVLACVLTIVQALYDLYKNLLTEWGGFLAMTCIIVLGHAIPVFATMEV